MNSDFTFENIFLAKAEPANEQGDLDFYLFFKNGVQPFHFQGNSKESGLILKFLAAFERRGARRLFSTIGQTLVCNEWTESLHHAYLRKLVDDAKAPSSPHLGPRTGKDVQNDKSI